jgi:hypothetical protein
MTLATPAAQPPLAAERNPFLVPTLQTQQRDESTLRIATAQHLADLFDLDGTKLIATLKLIPLPVVVHQQNGFEIPTGGEFGNVIENR